MTFVQNTRLASRLQDDSTLETLRFAQRVGKQASTFLCLIQTQDMKQRSCWFLLKTTERQLIRLKCTLADEQVNLHDYGEIIESGWGEPPSYRAASTLRYPPRKYEANA